MQKGVESLEVQAIIKRVRGLLDNQEARQIQLDKSAILEAVRAMYKGKQHRLSFTRMTALVDRGKSTIWRWRKIHNSKILRVRAGLHA